MNRTQRNRNWMTDGLCNQSDPELFFPDKDAPATQVDAALRICADCPVRQACRSYAATTEQRHGIWGGHRIDGPTRVKQPVRLNVLLAEHAPQRPDPDTAREAA